MRLIIVTAATLLIAAAAPALAHVNNLSEPHTDCRDHSGITADDPYEGEMVIEDDLYAQAGWWRVSGAAADQAGGVSTDGPTWKCGGDMHANAETKQSPVWLHLTESHGENYEIRVTSHGAAVAAVDVFEYEAKDGWNNEATPECPQGLLFPDIYPESGEPVGQYLRRIISETVERHPRGQTVQAPIQLSAGGTNTISLSLDPGDSQNGEYMVAIYPQAGTTLQADENTALQGEDKISYEVFGDDGATIKLSDGESPPFGPYAADDWVLPTSNLFDCADQAVPLPPVIMGGDAPELRTPGPGASDLLTTHLEPAE